MQRLTSHTFLKTSIRKAIQNHRLKTMQAWQTFEYGHTDKLQLNPMSQIPIIRSPIDLLIKVHAASVNELDVRMLGMIIKTYLLNLSIFLYKFSKC